MNRKTALFLPFVFVCATAAAQAGANGALSLSPAVVPLRGDFGQSTTQRLTLVNGTSLPFSFDLVAQDVVVKDGTRSFVDAGSIAGSIAATAVFSSRHVEVPAGESVSVTATFTLPADTSQRAVVAIFRGTNQIRKNGVPMTASLGTLLTFTLSDDIAMGARPLSVRPQSPSENLAVSGLCENSGKEPFVTRGVVAILDRNGALRGRTDIAPHRLLPGERTELGAEYPGELEAGRYRVLVTLDYEGHTLRQSAEVEVR
jgi:hypothetical protein